MLQENELGTQLFRFSCFTKNLSYELAHQFSVAQQDIHGQLDVREFRTFRSAERHFLSVCFS
jgi:hypothetical protein